MITRVFTIELEPTKPGLQLVGGAPDGHDARLLAELAAGEAGCVLHVALDDARAARLAQTVAFFAPELEIEDFPAWDCLPYDRVSPNPEIAGRRMHLLARLASGTAPDLIITTVNAMLQRVPPRSALGQSSYAAGIGDRVDLQALQDFLAYNGYTRSQTVREHGEYAVRGGIVDLFPPSGDEPVRLDLFGDELEALRSFDPVTQRTTGKEQRIVLTPMSELLLDDESRGRFRSGYRALFGAVSGDDPLYEAVRWVTTGSAGVFYAIQYGPVIPGHLIGWIRSLAVDERERPEPPTDALPDTTTDTAPETVTDPATETQELELDLDPDPEEGEPESAVELDPVGE